MREVYFLGCDPGPKTGAIVILTLSGDVHAWVLMPKIVLGGLKKTRTVKSKVLGEKPKKVTKEDGKLTDTDIKALAAWFELNLKDKVVYAGVEDVKPFQAPIARNVVGLFQKNLGSVITLCTVWCKKLFMLPPRTWQASLYLGKADKGKSIKLAKELIPELAGPISSSGESGSGVAEAGLMAEVVRQKFVWVFSRKEKGNVEDK
jgi:hypothetical protein